MLVSGFVASPLLFFCVADFESFLGKERESSSVLEVVMEWEWQLEVWGKKESRLWKEEAK
jgi:hypothetical protein